MVLQKLKSSKKGPPKRHFFPYWSRSTWFFPVGHLFRLWTKSGHYCGCSNNLNFNSYAIERAQHCLDGKIFSSWPNVSFFPSCLGSGGPKTTQQTSFSFVLFPDGFHSHRPLRTRFTCINPSLRPSFSSKECSGGSTIHLQICVYSPQWANAASIMLINLYYEARNVSCQIETTKQ